MRPTKTKHRCQFSWLQGDLLETFDKKFHYIANSCEQHLKSNPNQATRNLYGYVLYRQEKFSKARQQFEAILQNDPNNKVALANLVYLNAEQGRQSDSEAFESRLRDTPTSTRDLANLHWNLAYLYTRIYPHAPKAITPYEQAIETAPDYPAPYLYLSMIYVRLARSNCESERHVKQRQNALKAITKIQTMLRLPEVASYTPKFHSLAHIQLGRAYANLIHSGESTFDIAIAHFQHAINLCTDEDSLRFYADFLSRHSEQHEEAERLLKESIDTHPNTFAHQQLAKLYENRKYDLNKSLKEQNRLLKLECKKNKKRGGQTDKIRTLKDEIDSIHDHIAQMNELIIEHLQLAIEAKPTNYSAHNKLMRNLLSQAKYNAVIDHYSEYPEFENESDFTICAVKAYLAINEQDSAMKLLRRHVHQYRPLLKKNIKAEIISTIKKLYATDELHISKWRIWCNHELEKAQVTLCTLLHEEPQNLELLYWALQVSLLINDEIEVQALACQIAEYDDIQDIPDVSGTEIRELAAKSLSKSAFTHEMPLALPEAERMHRDQLAITVKRLLLVQTNTQDTKLQLKAWQGLALLYARAAISAERTAVRSPAHWEIVAYFMTVLSTLPQTQPQPLDDPERHRQALGMLLLSLGCYGAADKHIAEVEISTPGSTLITSWLEERKEQEQIKLYDLSPYKLLQWIREHYLTFVNEKVTDNVLQETIHDLILKLRQFLDQLFYQFASPLTDKVRNLYFPCRQENSTNIDENLENFLVHKIGINNFRQIYPSLFNALLEIQPLFDERNVWIENLRQLRNIQMHAQLLSEEERINERTILTQALAEQAFFKIQAIADNFKAAADGATDSFGTNIPDTEFDIDLPYKHELREALYQTLIAHGGAPSNSNQYQPSAQDRPEQSDHDTEQAALLNP